MRRKSGGVEFVRPKSLDMVVVVGVVVVVVVLAVLVAILVESWEW